MPVSTRVKNDKTYRETLYVGILNVKNTVRLRPRQTRRFAESCEIVLFVLFLFNLLGFADFYCLNFVIALQ